MSRIEQSLATALAAGDHPGCPPKLVAAMRYAVFPRGARIRPRLCLAVAAACGDDQPDIAESAASAIELLHCASLVHDDLPCFDDADIRRGRPSVHRAFGEPLAVLAGDALIVLAFQTLARGAMGAPARLPALLATIGMSVGIPCGIVAGQAWECEQDVDLAQYQREKTGALFAAATVAGAAAAGGAAECWREVGMRLGEAFQIADDILDATGKPEMLGKPAGQDCAHARPSAVLRLGLYGAIARLQELSDSAVEAVPPCPGRSALRSHIRTETMRLLPQELARHAA